MWYVRGAPQPWQFGGASERRYHSTEDMKGAMASKIHEGMFMDRYSLEQQERSLYLTPQSTRMNEELRGQKRQASDIEEYNASRYNLEHYERLLYSTSQPIIHKDLRDVEIWETRDKEKRMNEKKKIQSTKNTTASLMTEKPRHLSISLHLSTIMPWMPGEKHYMDLNEEARNILEDHGGLQQTPNDLRSLYADKYTNILCHDIPEVLTFYQNEVFSSHYFTLVNLDSKSYHVYGIGEIQYISQYTGMWRLRIGLISMWFKKEEREDVLYSLYFKIMKRKEQQCIFKRSIQENDIDAISNEVIITPINRIFNNTFEEYRTCTLSINEFDDVILRYYKASGNKNLIKVLKIYHKKNVDADKAIISIHESFGKLTSD
jgi:hypothetical protein